MHEAPVVCEGPPHDLEQLAAEAAAFVIDENYHVLDLWHATAPDTFSTVPVAVELTASPVGILASPLQSFHRTAPRDIDLDLDMELAPDDGLEYSEVFDGSEASIMRTSPGAAVAKESSAMSLEEGKGEQQQQQHGEGDETAALRVYANFVVIGDAISTTVEGLEAEPAQMGGAGKHLIRIDRRTRQLYACIPNLPQHPLTTPTTPTSTRTDNCTHCHHLHPLHKILGCPSLCRYHLYYAATGRLLGRLERCALVEMDARGIVLDVPDMVEFVARMAERVEWLLVLLGSSILVQPVPEEEEEGEEDVEAMEMDGEEGEGEEEDVLVAGVWQYHQWERSSSDVKMEDCCSEWETTVDDVGDDEETVLAEDDELSSSSSMETTTAEGGTWTAAVSSACLSPSPSPSPSPPQPLAPCPSPVPLPAQHLLWYQQRHASTNNNAAAVAAIWGPVGEPVRIDLAGNRCSRGESGGSTRSTRSTRTRSSSSSSSDQGRQEDLCFGASGGDGDCCNHRHPCHYHRVAREYGYEHEHEHEDRIGWEAQGGRMESETEVMWPRLREAWREALKPVW
ncbi:hypothetical protein B0T17DRAFT_635174 [Bombardia bombarda]|uniref:Uncharacterized protein n=1 Tax=Bombardia bombarda TaxID=252184 RepID=A0AA39X9J6_9PEZI|nr:hypothetical protein B0T17DRAFT_635174 [Bombardia bombarda]